MWKLKPADKLMKARMQLLLHQPFFGTLTLGLKTVEIPSGTMATDGFNLYWCAKFVEECTLDEVIGAICHEVLHVANKHHMRQGHREHKRWNIACDAAINPICLEAGLKLPKGVINIPEFKDLSSEVIYARLPESPPQGGSGAPGQDQGDGQPNQAATAASGGSPEDGQGWGSVLPAPTMSEAERVQHEHQININVRQAHMAQRMKGQGKTPAWMDRLVEDVCKPKLDWRKLLRQFISETRPTDRSWGRPNRRHIHAGLYLPGPLPDDGFDEFVLITDTSGSMDDDELSQCHAEQKMIVQDLLPRRSHFISCDSDATRVQTFEEGEDFDPIYTGGGGSDFRPAFDLIEQQGIKPACAIVLSDMMITFPSEAPDYPVLCISTTKQFGPAWAPTIFLEV